MISLRISGICCSYDENIARDKLRDDEDIMGPGRIRELNDMFRSQGDGTGIVFDNSGLSIEESVDRLILLIEEKEWM